MTQESTIVSRNFAVESYKQRINTEYIENRREANQENLDVTEFIEQRILIQYIFYHRIFNLTLFPLILFGETLVKVLNIELREF